MGGLGHYFEDEGLPTTQISLIRAHTETIRPPRALWVPFILGRPLGQPGDADFQLRVLRGVLGLLEESSGPVLVDHDEDADGDVALDGLSCPISYAQAEGDGSLSDRLAAEIADLQTWYDLGVERTGRTSFGGAGLDIGGVCVLLTSIADGSPPTPEVLPSGDRHLGDQVRFAGEDLKAFVTEAVAAQPATMSPFAMKAWFWDQSIAGETLLAAYRAGLEHPDDTVRMLIPALLPKELR